MSHPANLEVRTVPGKGRGVFALVAFYRGQTIENCPILEFPNGHAKHDGILHQYTFAWTGRRSALALGYGSLLNHSYTPNAAYSFSVAKKIIRIRALRNIEPGEDSHQLQWGCERPDAGGIRRERLMMSETKCEVP